VPTFAQHGWVQSSSELLLWNLLTVKSGLDPHMINELKDGFKIASGYFCGPVDYQP
jgi:hypothetical protein